MIILSLLRDLFIPSFFFIMPESPPPSPAPKERSILHPRSREAPGLYVAITALLISIGTAVQAVRNGEPAPTLPPIPVSPPTEPPVPKPEEASGKNTELSQKIIEALRRSEAVLKKADEVGKRVEESLRSE
ncbi:MAG: hypothetical protein Q8P95_05105 [bacterium]|nr:hypothetical protein [bacterium]